MPSGPLDSNQPATDTLVTIERVSKSRRALSKTLVALPALAGATVHAQTTQATPDRPAAGQKVLRYAFRVAETGFDPAQVNDLYSSTVIANIFDAPLTYDFLARPAKIVPNTAVALPEVSDDFRTLTIRLRPGIFFQDHPAFQGKRRELIAQDYVYSIKRIYDPKLKSPRVYLLENAKLLGMNEIRAAALKGAKFDIDREVEGVRALDRYTFQLRLGEPSPRFHLYLADNSFLGAVAREVAEMYDDKQLLGQSRSAPARSGSPTGDARRAWCSSAIPATATMSTSRSRPRATPSARRWPRSCAAASCRWWTASRSTSSRKTSRAGSLS